MASAMVQRRADTHHQKLAQAAVVPPKRITKSIAVRIPSAPPAQSSELNHHKYHQLRWTVAHRAYPSAYPVCAPFGREEKNSPARAAGHVS
jgi:hypothetical protein